MEVEAAWDSGQEAAEAQAWTTPEGVAAVVTFEILQPYKFSLAPLSSRGILNVQ
jgi:hypothetical protein